MSESTSIDDPVQGPSTGGRLMAKALRLDTFRENVILLSRQCTALRPERLRGVRKVEISARGVVMLAVPMLCDDPALVSPGEAGIPEPLARRLCVRDGEPVQVAPASPLRTLEAVKAKVAGESLGLADYEAIARDLAQHRWSDIEISAFLVACASFMTADETLDLTRAMVAAGDRLSVTRSVAETVSVVADPSPPPRVALPAQLVLGEQRYGR